MKILAVTSGKGGVGKTTLALNIARQLSLRGCKTLIIDLDIHNKGATGLFLDKIEESTYSVIRITEDSDQFEKPAKEIAKLVTPLTLDKDGNLLFIPAAKPKDLIRWKKFISPNDRIIRFFRELIHELAEQHDIDCVVIDCYGGIDTLTVAAAGIADDTILINEPDIITFSGTLMLYTYLADTYKESEFKPNLHFVINRITSRHSFYFLEREYRKHLSELAVTKSILSYLPYDKLVMEAFGDYPFFTELLPKGLLTRKIHLLICSLWKDSVFAPFSKLSKRKKNRIFRKTREHPFADPERILRTLVSVPFLLIVPFAILVLLSGGLPVESLHYRSIQIAYLFSIYMLIFLVGYIVFFEPLQVSRWLIRVENYKRRRRRLVRQIKGAFNLPISGWMYSRAVLPALIGFGISLGLAVGLFEEDPDILWKRNLEIWPKTIDGFRAGGNYSRLQLGYGATIKNGTNMQRTNLSHSDLSGTILSDVDFSYSNMTNANLAAVLANGTYFDSVNLFRSYLSGAHLIGSSFNHARLSGVYLGNAEMTGASLRYAIIENVGLANVVMISADLTKSTFRESDLSGARLDSAILSGTKLISTKLTNCNLTGADLRDTEFINTPTLKEAILYRANLVGNKTLEVEDLSYAMASGALLDDVQKKIVMDSNAKKISGPIREVSNKEYLEDSIEKDYEAFYEDPNQPGIPHAVDDFVSSFKGSLVVETVGEIVYRYIISGSPENMSKAKEYLIYIKIYEDRLTDSDNYGLILLLDLLYAIIQGDDPDAESKAAQVYFDWLRESEEKRERENQYYYYFNERYDLSSAWSWELWNEHFPYHSYSRKQNIKLRAVILLSESEIKDKAWIKRLFAINHSSE